ncbi:gamma-glutamylcyclotransferase family protein [Propionibacteriaceae bacterium Y1685]|uniref:gamma-glutamylcyclotransferase family protein n=1 Tax=Microlunatus sp. Y1700 TaxID=3418487 RepID=UPI003B79C933
MATVLYAAYGSNLDPQQMAERCPHSILRGTGWLEGWRLTFGGDGWDGALPTLAEDVGEASGSHVFVGLYDVTEADADALDGWESARDGLYRRVRFRVQMLDGEQTAWAYVLDDFEGGLPSARTIGLLADAAQAAGAPDDYVAELRSRPCTSGW